MCQHAIIALRHIMKLTGVQPQTNNSAKDLFADDTTALVKAWTTLKEVGRVTHLWKQIRRDNHLLDCELMILVAAVVTKIAQVRNEHSEDRPKII